MLFSKVNQWWFQSKDSWKCTKQRHRGARPKKRIRPKQAMEIDWNEPELKTPIGIVCNGSNTSTTRVVTQQDDCEAVNYGSYGRTNQGTRAMVAKNHREKLSPNHHLQTGRLISSWAETLLMTCIDCIEKKQNVNKKETTVLPTCWDNGLLPCEMIRICMSWHVEVTIVDNEAELNV